MKKLAILMTGALAAFAVAALPAVATAGEFTADCESSTSCSATITGGIATLTNSNNEKIECASTDGTATQTHNSSTGTTELTFTGCKERVSGFGFACNSPGAASGVITTNPMVSHLIYIDPLTLNEGTPGVLLTGANVTFSCAAYLKKNVTGNIIGHWTDPQCRMFAASHTVTFEQISAGNQKYTQVTTTGTKYDLISNNDTELGAYLTSSQTGTGTLTAENNNKARFTCHVTA